MRPNVFITAVCLGLFHGGPSSFAQENAPVPFATSKIELGMVGLAGDAFVVTTLQTQHVTVMENYTIEVPYQETVDGKTETRTRSEKRAVQVLQKRLLPIITKVPAEAAAFSSAAGKRIADLSVVRTALASPRAAVIIYSLEPLEDFYRKILNPSTVVIHIDESKLARKAPPPMPIPNDTRIQPAGPPPAPTPDPAANVDAK